MIHINRDMFCLVVGPKITKKLIPLELPALNMPQKTHKRVTETRPYRSIVQETPEIIADKHVYYSNLSELVKRISNLKTLENWETKISQSEVILWKNSL